MKKLGLGALAGVLAVTLAACGGSGSDDADAEGYPDDDITMVISYAAGGPTDLAGRSIAKALEGDFGVSVVVENVEGASGAIGTAEVVNGRADGYTIAMTTSSAVSRVPLIESVGFTKDDVVPIGVVKQHPGVVVVRSDSPYQTAEEFFDAAEADPNGIKVGTAGAQTPQAVEISRLAKEYDVELQLVPFQGDAPSITALLGKNVDAIIPGYGDSVAEYVNSGEFRVLALMAPERIDELPDVPTLAELGYDKLIYGVTQYILAAPADTPEEIVTKLEDALETALADPEVRTELGELGIPAEFIGSEELSAQLDEEVEVLEPVLKELFG